MRSLKNDSSAYVQAVSAVIAVLVSMIIAVIVWFKIDGALAASTTFTALPSGARAAWNSTNATANTSLTLMPIVAIVMIAGVVLAVVTGFGRGPA